MSGSILVLLPCVIVKQWELNSFDNLSDIWVGYNSGSNKGLVSKLYHGITSLNKDTTDYLKQQWDKELDIEITEDMWLNAWETQSEPPTLGPGETSVGRA